MNYVLHNIATNPIYAIVFWCIVLSIAAVVIIIYRQRKKAKPSLESEEPKDWENVSWDDLPYPKHFEIIIKNRKYVCFGYSLQRIAPADPEMFSQEDKQRLAWEVGAVPGGAVLVLQGHYLRLVRDNVTLACCVLLDSGKSPEDELKASASYIFNLYEVKYPPQHPGDGKDPNDDDYDAEAHGDIELTDEDERHEAEIEEDERLRSGGIEFQAELAKYKKGSVTVPTGPQRKRKTVQPKSPVNGKGFKPTDEQPTPLIIVPGRASFRRLADPERYACAKLLVWGFTTEQLQNYFGVSKTCVLESARGYWKHATEYLKSDETTSLYIKAFRLGKKSKHHDYLATNTDKTTTLAIQLLLDLNILHREYFAEAFDVSLRMVNYNANRYQKSKLHPHQQKILDNLKNGPAVLLADVDMGNGS